MPRPVTVLLACLSLATLLLIIEAGTTFNWSSKMRSRTHVTLPPVSRAKLQEMAKILRNSVRRLKYDNKRPTELIFIIDSSKSVGDKNFSMMIGFVRSMLSDIEVDTNSTRVSVITYSSPSRVNRHLDYLQPNLREGYDLRNKCSLKYDLDKIPYDGGQTYTLGGFLEGQVSLDNYFKF